MTSVRDAAIRLRESTASSLAFREADASGAVVRGVLLLRAGPGNLADRHYYSNACIQDAANSGVFEGAQMYLDHPTPQEEREGVRSVEKLAGWYDNVVAKPFTDPQLGQTLGLFADLHPAVGNAKALEIIRTCAEFAKAHPRNAYAGLSINAMGDGEPDTINSEQWDRVDAITAVDSVDIVTKAGAGGAIIPLKESCRMAKTKDGLRLTIDADKVREGARSLLEGAKTQLVQAKLKEAGTEKLTDEQLAEIDKDLGLTEGGKLDGVLESATSVEDEGVVEADKPAAKDNEPDGDEIDAMSEADAKKALRASRAAHKASEAKVAESTRKVTEASRSLRERMAEDVMHKLNIPETFRARLKDELIERNYPTEQKMREHAQAFDKAFIRPQLDGAGVVALAGAPASAGKIDFTFEGGN